MRLGILGYGKMGQQIEKIALNRGNDITLIIDQNNADEFTIENLKSKVDVAIDFSIPNAAFNNIQTCFQAGIPIVSGTTGWLEKYDEIMKQQKALDGTFLYASNFSLGVNLFFELNKRLAHIMNAYSASYHVNMTETHHTQKLDAPSGTAITLAEGIIQEYEGINDWFLNEKNDQRGGAIGIEALRIGQVPGDHNVKYESDYDTIEIKHSAKTREGFALGAVIAAEFLVGKVGVFSMKDVLGLQ